MKKICCLVLLLSALNCPTAFAQIDTVANISTQDKLYGLSKFWWEVSANFAYFDHAKVNWDSTYRAYIPKVIATKNTWEYYMLMQRFCALLKDGHTGVGVIPDIEIARSPSDVIAGTDTVLQAALKEMSKKTK
jgi:carboxyl-terminal processing protease